ncbi:hypothetical protein AVEN_111938-1 [Araneus ventricosus]|uniref:Uncharacterized protein n=1 Tax=Araneus ventricosus TaxID=182803 RepID=A0A4Y2L2M4_ARAVE|nr:hypothetical protein AVEN_111938-1 [Araneus ventricosus]
MRREILSSRSKTFEVWSKWIGSGGITKNSKSKTPSANSNFDLDARVARKQRICLHWDLALRLEMKLEIPLCDFEPCLKTNFGTSVNDLPNFSTKMSGIQTSC